MQQSHVSISNNKNKQSHQQNPKQQQPKTTQKSQTQPTKKKPKTKQTTKKNPNKNQTQILVISNKCLRGLENSCEGSQPVALTEFLVQVWPTRKNCPLVKPMSHILYIKVQLLPLSNSFCDHNKSCWKRAQKDIGTTNLVFQSKCSRA